MNRLPISTQASFNTFQRNNAPALVDIDLDGDFDLIVGHRSDSISTYINQDGVFHRSYGLTNPFYAVDLENPRPTFVDIDNDGDPDAFIGDRDGKIHYFRNDNGTFSKVNGAGNPFNNVDVGIKSSPTFVDIDIDGDPDAFVSEFGGFHFFRNDNGVFSEVTDSGNPFDGVSTEFGSPIAFVDIDNDGDPDAFAGTYRGGDIRFFRNVAGSFTQVSGSENPLNVAKVSSGYSRPVFADMDGDGDSDAYIGGYREGVHYYKNNSGSFTEEEVVSDFKFNGVDVTGSSAPTFADLDNDNDEDVIVGLGTGKIQSFTNDNGVFNEAIGANNPFDGFDVGFNAKPVLIDFNPADSDEDLDLFVGAGDGTIHFYKNTEGDFLKITGTGNPMDGLTVGSNAAPTFVDFDGDNDKDAFVGAGDGTIHYFRNNNGVFAKITGAGNPFNGIDVGDRASPTFFPFASSRAFVGSADGSIKEFKKIGSQYILVADSPFLTVDVGFNSTPTIPSGNNVYVGNSAGSIFGFRDDGGRSNVWQGPFTSSWHGDPNNWELMTTPISGCDDVHVFGNSTLKVDPSQLAEGRTLTVRQGGLFEVKATAELNIDPD